MIGPSNVPSPPTSTMKIMYAVHCTLKIDVGSMKSVFASVIAPAAPQPAAASTNSTRLPAITRTPTDAAASSSSRIACSDAPEPAPQQHEEQHEEARSRSRASASRCTAGAACGE